MLSANSTLLELLAYPSQDEALIQARIQELQSLEIEEVFETGLVKVRGHSVLGKGYCGLLLLAAGCDHSSLALKVRRVDAGPSTLKAEAEALAIANQLKIGPTLYTHSDHFIAMEYLSGPTFYEWLQTDVTQAAVHRVLSELLQQCYRLDQAGLDHGDLRCITEHVIFRGNSPIIIDFSRSSRDRRPANVTTIIQGFFWGTILPNFIARYYPAPDRGTVVPFLRQYKQQPTQKHFEQILSQLELRDMYQRPSVDAILIDNLTD